MIDSDGSYHFGRLSQLFHLVNASKYSYMENSSGHGIVLDNWMFMGDFDLPPVSYRNMTIEISIARSGFPITRDLKTVPWRISLQGTIIVNQTVNITISTVSCVFDLSFKEPTFDVCDISVCFEPMDYVILVMSVPKGPNNRMDYITFRKNARQSVVDYTQVVFIQVGNMEVGQLTNTKLVSY